MARSLVALTLAWPLILAGATFAGIHDRLPAATATVYFTAGRVCHQRPERSFHTRGVQWPVCGRCSGLYLGAPLGAVVAIAGRRGFLRRGFAVALLGLAVAPTALTLAVELTGLASVTTFLRYVAAVPLGAALAWVIIRVAR